MDKYLKPNSTYERLWAEYNKYKSLIVAVDFDDTLYDFHKDGGTYFQVQKLIRDLKEIGCFIIIWTGNQDTGFVINYLNKSNIPFDTINDEAPVSKKLLGDKFPRKVYANVYVDDRAGIFQVYDDLTKLVENVRKYRIMNYEKIKYPDGSSYVKVTQYEKDFTFRIESYENLWTLNQVVDVYNNVGLVPTITIPCLLDAQADRRFNENESFGLRLVIKFLSGLNANFKIFHPHNTDALEFGANNIEVIDNSEFLIKCLYELDGGSSGFNTNLTTNLIIVSPDAGMYKPLMKFCDKINWQGETYSASKSRQYVDGKSKLIQEIDRNNFGGSDILLVDDICVGGGTFIGLAKMLKERNCGEIYLAVSHITSDKVNSELFEVFDKVFTTNSKTIVEKYKNQLEIINLF